MLRIEPECDAMRKLIFLVTLPFLVDAAVAYALAQPRSVSQAAVDIYPVFFDWDQAVLSQQARAELTAARQAAAEGRPSRVAVAGAQDMLAGPGYRAALAQARRRSISAELHRGGAPTPVMLEVTQ